ncbi:MAG: hypothetical protein PGN12_07355 [Sphingomonas phyllosphaerae]
MIQVEEKRLFAAASTASSISALCALVSDSLGASPETSVAAEAVDGLGEMAQALSNGLHEAAQATPTRTHGTTPGDNRHAAWLVERRTLLNRAETLTDGTAAHDAACVAVNKLDRRIMTTPATTESEMLAKLMLMAVVNIEGATISERDAATMLAEAEPFLAREARS